MNGLLQLIWVSVASIAEGNEQGAAYKGKKMHFKHPGASGNKLAMKDPIRHLKY